MVPIVLDVEADGRHRKTEGEREKRGLPPRFRAENQKTVRGGEPDGDDARLHAEPESTMMRAAGTDEILFDSLFQLRVEAGCRAELEDRCRSRIYSVHTSYPPEDGRGPLPHTSTPLEPQRQAGSASRRCCRLVYWSQEVVIFYLSLHSNGIEVHVADILDFGLLPFAAGAQQHVEGISRTSNQDPFSIHAEYQMIAGIDFGLDLTDSEAD